MKASRRIRKTVCSSKVAPHWASHCKLSQGKDFASKLESLEEKRLANIGANPNIHEQELEELEDYFGMVRGECREPGHIVGFALHAIGPTTVKTTSAKFAMKLKSAAEASRAHEDVDALHAEDRQLQEALAWTSTSLSNASGQSPQRGNPVVTFNEYDVSSNPGQGSIPSLSSIPSPSPRVRDPVTIQELQEATAPVLIRRQDLEPTVPRRAVCDGATHEEGGGSHYVYFQRHLPNESPRYRAAMQKRVTEERQMQPTCWIRGPQPRRLHP